MCRKKIRHVYHQCIFFMLVQNSVHLQYHPVKQIRQFHTEHSNSQRRTVHTHLACQCHVTLQRRLCESSRVLREDQNEKKPVSKYLLKVSKIPYIIFIMQADHMQNVRNTSLQHKYWHFSQIEYKMGLCDVLLFLSINIK